jgi:ABC-type hemin transport system ATPase subunit
MATHDLADADGADVVLLLAGRLIAIGPPSEVLTDEHLRASFGFTGRH